MAKKMCSSKFRQMLTDYKKAIRRYEQNGGSDPELQEEWEGSMDDYQKSYRAICFYVGELEHKACALD